MENACTPLDFCNVVGTRPRRIPEAENTEGVGTQPPDSLASRKSGDMTPPNPLTREESYYQHLHLLFQKELGSLSEICPPMLKMYCLGVQDFSHCNYAFNIGGQISLNDRPPVLLDLRI